MFRTEIREYSRNSYMVLVFEYKFNVVRQESYWALRKNSRMFKTKTSAERYAAKFI